MTAERERPAGWEEGGSGTALPPLGPAARLGGALFALLLHLLGRTWRRKAEGLDRLDALLARGERVLAVFWHGNYLPLFMLLAGRSACIFSSRSFRGEVIAAICRRFGYDGRPLPQATAGKGVEAMRGILGGCRLAALAVDGPLGPLHIVKPGAVRLASELAFIVVPVVAAGRRQWVVARRWDRMAIPRPFTRVALVCGEPVTIPAGLPEEAMEGWCEVLRQRLEATDRRARQLAES